MNFLKKVFFGSSNKEQKQQQIVQLNKQQQTQQIPVQALNQIFEKSAKFISQSTKTISDQDKLIIYGLYKQATIGDCNTAKPSILDFVGKSKWASWDSNRGISKTNAMKAYITKSVEIDSEIQTKMKCFLEGITQVDKANDKPIKCSSSSVQSGVGFKQVEKKDYSETYSHPYFKLIQHGKPIPKQEITKELLLQKNNNPKCYPLHFAIDKQRVDLVQSFLQILAVDQIVQMVDEQGTGIEEYAQLIQNADILELIRSKLG